MNNTRNHSPLQLQEHHFYSTIVLKFFPFLFLMAPAQAHVYFPVPRVVHSVISCVSLSSISKCSTISSSSNVLVYCLILSRDSSFFSFDLQQLAILGVSISSIVCGGSNNGDGPSDITTGVGERLRTR